MAKRYRHKRRPSRRTRRRTRRGVRRLKFRRGRKPSSAQFARTVESYNDTLNFGDSFDLTSWSLADGFLADRTAVVARFYREFRIKWVQVTFKMPYNMFQYTNSIVPYMYFMHDYEGTMGNDYNLTEDNFNDMGIKPVKLVKWKKITFKPRVRYAMQDATNKLNVCKTMAGPWLSTNQNVSDPTVDWAPSEIDHYGLKGWISDLAPGTVGVQFPIQVRICFEFRKPLFTTYESAQMPLAVDEVKIGEETLVEDSAHAPGEVAEGGTVLPPPR